MTRALSGTPEVTAEPAPTKNMFSCQECLFGLSIMGHRRGRNDNCFNIRVFKQFRKLRANSNRWVFLLKICKGVSVAITNTTEGAKFIHVTNKIAAPVACSDNPYLRRILLLTHAFVPPLFSILRELNSFLPVWCMFFKVVINFNVPPFSYRPFTHLLNADLLKSPKYI